MRKPPARALADWANPSLLFSCAPGIYVRGEKSKQSRHQRSKAHLWLVRENRKQTVGVAQAGVGGLETLTERERKRTDVGVAQAGELGDSNRGRGWD